MTEATGMEQGAPGSLVEIYVGSGGISAAAGATDTRLSPEQIAAIQQTVTTLINGFRPPEAHADDDKIFLNSLEVHLGFTLQAGSGPALKLFLDASAQASILVKVVWSRKK
jgi:hypothetical protein